MPPPTGESGTSYRGVPYPALWGWSRTPPYGGIPYPLLGDPSIMGGAFCRLGARLKRRSAPEGFVLDREAFIERQGISLP